MILVFGVDTDLKPLRSCATVAAFHHCVASSYLVVSYSAWRVPTLWIDESPMNLCEILGLQPKGVATLSFSSRKRPAYAGMTGLLDLHGCLWIGMD